MEIGQVITFEGKNWSLEDIKSLGHGEHMLILSRTEDACVNPIEFIKKKYTCADCGLEGEFNTEIGYLGDEYMCHSCLKECHTEIYGRCIEFKIFSWKIRIQIWT